MKEKVFCECGGGGILRGAREVGARCDAGGKKKKSTLPKAATPALSRAGKIGAGRGGWAMAASGKKGGREKKRYAARKASDEL